MSFPQGPQRRHQTDWDKLLHTLSDHARRLRAIEGGSPLRAAEITATDEGLTFNSNLYLTTDEGGNVEPAMLRAFWNGTDTAVKLLPPYAVGAALDETSFYLVGPTLAAPDGRAYLIAGGDCYVEAGQQLLLNSDDLVDINAGGQVTIEGGGILMLQSGATGWGLRDGATSSGSAHAIYTSGNDTIVRAPTRFYVAANLYATGTISAGGVKSFVIDHPLHDDMSLVHAATESPVAGIEYTGEAELDDEGTAVVTLPDYFEALAAADSRTVQVTPIGFPFQVGAERVVGGEFTVYGDPGRSVCWHVRARRGDAAGQFDVEIPRAQAPNDPEETS